MPLFGKKKSKKKESSNLPDLPDLPDFPGAEKSLNFPRFPEQEKKFQPPEQQHKIDNFPRLEPLNLQSEIPKREKIMPKFKPITAPFKPRPIQKEFKIPEQAQPIEEFTRPTLHPSKPIYVKIEKFQEATSSIDKIKDKIRQADDILEEISRLRAEEDKELDLWHADLNSIKERLLRIDKALFGGDQIA